MALTDPWILVDNSAANQTFVRRPQLVLDGSDWVENDATSALVRYAQIRFSNAGPSNTPGGAPKRRCALMVGIRKYNTLTAKTDVFQFTGSFVTDAASGITDAERSHVIAMGARSAYSDATFLQLLRGEA